MSALKFVRDLVTVNHLICFRIFIPPRVYLGIVCFPAKFLSFKSFFLRKSPIIGNACHLLTNSLTH